MRLQDKTVTTQDGETGRIKGERRCQLHGCLGLRLIVEWPDGKRTHPCTKGMVVTSDGNWKLGGES